MSSIVIKAWVICGSSGTEESQAFLPICSSEECWKQATHRFMERFGREGTLGHSFFILLPKAKVTLKLPSVSRLRAHPGKFDEGDASASPDIQLGCTTIFTKENSFLCPAGISLATICDPLPLVLLFQLTTLRRQAHNGSGINYQQVLKQNCSTTLWMELRVAAILPFCLPAQPIPLLTRLQLMSGKGTLKSSPQFKEEKKREQFLTVTSIDEIIIHYFLASVPPFISLNQLTRGWGSSLSARGKEWEQQTQGQNPTALTCDILNCCGTTPWVLSTDREVRRGLGQETAN